MTWCKPKWSNVSFRKPSQQQAGQPIASFWDLHRIIFGVLMDLFFTLVCCHRIGLCLITQSISWTEACQATLSMEILQARILEWITTPSSKGTPNQGSNPSLPYCRQILYWLSHQGDKHENLGFISHIDARGGNGNPLQCSCLENYMHRGAWQASVHWVTKSQTRLRD